MMSVPPRGIFVRTEYPLALSCSAIRWPRIWASVSSFDPITMVLPSPPPLHPKLSRASSKGRITAVRFITRYRSQIEVWHFLVDNRPQLWSETAVHARLVALALLLAIPPAVAIGVAAARRPRLAGLAIGSAGVIFTIPSLALFALLVGPLGLGTAPAVAALALNSVLPVLRNTVVGLQEVPPDAIEAEERRAGKKSGSRRLQYIKNDNS